MPLCALPEHLNDKEEIENAFPDDSQYGGFLGDLWKRWNKWVKPMEAWGPRCPEGIAFTIYPPFILFKKWRSTPIVLWAKKGCGAWRFEADGKPDRWFVLDDPRAFLEVNPGYYLSRIQCWTDKHAALQWPLFFSCHSYNDGSDILIAPDRSSRDGQIKNFYIGAKRDADTVFWWIAAFFGKTFK